MRFWAQVNFADLAPYAQAFGVAMPSAGLADLGVAFCHRRRIAEAREPLRRVLDLAIRCGATQLAERAGTELLIAGARPRRPWLTGADALTTNERRLATMAADGRSDREIAQALYVSHKTVEKHLTAAYRSACARERTCRRLSQKSRGPSPYPRRSHRHDAGRHVKDRPHRPPVHGSGHLPAPDGPPDAQRRHPRVYSRTPRSS